MDKKWMRVVVIGIVILLCAFGVKECYAWDGLDKTEIGYMVRFTTRINPPDSTLTEAIRSALDELLSFTEAIVGSTTVVLAANQEAYSLPSDCLKVRKVCKKGAVGGRCLDRMDDWAKGKIHEGMSAAIDDIQSWSSEVDGYIKMLWIYPVPSAEDSLTVWYVPNPRTSIITFGADSASVEIEPREAYHPALVSLVKAYVCEYADRFDKARYFRELAITQINNANQNLRQPPSEIFLGPREVPRVP